MAAAAVPVVTSPRKWCITVRFVTEDSSTSPTSRSILEHTQERNLSDVSTARKHLDKKLTCWNTCQYTKGSLEIELVRKSKSDKKTVAVAASLGCGTADNNICDTNVWISPTWGNTKYYRESRERWRCFLQFSKLRAAVLRLCLPVMVCENSDADGNTRKIFSRILPNSSSVVQV